MLWLMLAIDVVQIPPEALSMMHSLVFALGFVATVISPVFLAMRGHATE